MSHRVVRIEYCCLDVQETYRVACANELVNVDGDVARFLRAAVDRCVGHCDISRCISVLSSMKEGGRRDAIGGEI